MGWLERVGGRSPQPSTKQWKVRDEPGPLTAHEAWALVRPVAHELDSQARLTFLTSGLDMSPEGRSFTWEFMVALPRLKARALLSLEPSPDAAEIDEAPLFLAQRLNLVSTAELEGSPALPEPFRDSPEVVAELAAGGVDFVAGPSDMKLEARVPATGEAVWVTYYWDEERTARFSAEPAPTAP